MSHPVTFTPAERERIAIACLSSDTNAIPKVEGAGRILDIGGIAHQVMHNGLLVQADGYYGPVVTEIISQLRGHHEPQEERVFAVVLDTLPERPLMIELGSYWAYYSMWLLKTRPKARAICVEPIAHRRACGQQNLAINGLRAEVVAAAIGAHDAGGGEFVTGAETGRVPTRSIDSLITEREIQSLDILHADIQGFEWQALLGAANALSEQRIGWVFISTHRFLEDARTLDLHSACADILVAHGYKIVASHTPEESFSVDGLLVAKSPRAPGPAHIEVGILTADMREAVRVAAENGTGEE